MFYIPLEYSFLLSVPCHTVHKARMHGFPGDGVRHERVPYPDKIFVKRMVIRSYGLAAQLLSKSRAAGEGKMPTQGQAPRKIAFFLRGISRTDLFFPVFFPEK